MGRRFPYGIVSILILFAALVLARGFWLPAAASFLTVRDHLAQADCVVPLRGDDYFRFVKAVELVKAGYSQRIVVSTVPEQLYLVYYDTVHLVYGLDHQPQNQFLLNYFEHLGKNAEGIELTPRAATSTFEEAQATREWMLEKGYRSMILVTTPYHMRRARMIFRWVFHGTGITLYHAGSPSPFYDPPHWWRKERDVKYVVDEYLSLFFNVLYHFIFKKGNTAFDTP